MDINSLPVYYLPRQFCQPSPFAFPNFCIPDLFLLEAMYFGVPVVASNTAGPCEIIHHKHDGIILNDISLDAWYGAIEKLLTEDNFRKHLSKNARNKILTEFNWDKLSGQFYIAYESVLPSSNQALI